MTKNCKKCQRMDLLVKVLNKNILDLSGFFDYIADNYPETDKDITNFLDAMAVRQIGFNENYVKKVLSNKKARKKYYDKGELK